MSEVKPCPFCGNRPNMVKEDPMGLSRSHHFCAFLGGIEIYVPEAHWQNAYCWKGDINPDCQGTHVLPDQISALTEELNEQKALADKLAGALNRCASAAGAPHAPDGCLLVIRIVKEALKLEADVVRK